MCVRIFSLVSSRYQLALDSLHDRICWHRLAFVLLIQGKLVILQSLARDWQNFYFHELTPTLLILAVRCTTPSSLNTEFAGAAGRESVNAQNMEARTICSTCLVTCCSESC